MTVGTGQYRQLVSQHLTGQLVVVYLNQDAIIIKIFESFYVWTAVSLVPVIILNAQVYWFY